MKRFQASILLYKAEQNIKKNLAVIVNFKKKKYPQKTKTKDIGKLLYHCNIVKENTGIAVK